VHAVPASSVYGLGQGLGGRTREWTSTRQSRRTDKRSSRSRKATQDRSPSLFSRGEDVSLGTPSPRLARRWFRPDNWPSTDWYLPVTSGRGHATILRTSRESAPLGDSGWGREGGCLRDGALAAVQARIERFVNGGDPDSVLDRGALVEAEALMADAGTPPVGSEYPADVEVISAVARLHLCRAEALGAAGAHDKQLALGLLAGLWAIDADLVPVGLRQSLEDSGQLERNPAVLSAEGLKQNSRFQRTGDPADLDRALELFREALAVAPETHTGRNRLLANIAEMLAQRYKVAGLLDDLEEASTYSRAAADATPWSDPLREHLQGSLMAHLSAYAQVTGSVRELDEAIAVARIAAQADVPDRAQRLGALCGLLISRAQMTGDLRTIEEAVEVGRQCVEATNLDDPRLCAHLASLCAALLRRFLSLGRLGPVTKVTGVASACHQA
jgi:hypothetical protein